MRHRITCHRIVLRGVAPVLRENRQTPFDLIVAGHRDERARRGKLPDRRAETGVLLHEEAARTASDKVTLQYRHGHEGETEVFAATSSSTCWINDCQEVEHSHTIISTFISPNFARIPRSYRTAKCAFEQLHNSKKTKFRFGHAAQSRYGTLT